MSRTRKPWVVTSVSPITGPYKRRLFKTWEGAHRFVLLRRIFYLMGNPINSYTRVTYDWRIAD